MRAREIRERATAAGAFLAMASLLVGAPLAVQGQDAPATANQSGGQQAPQSTSPNPNGQQSSQSATINPATQPLDDTMEAGEAEAEEFSRKLVKWNHYDGRFFSIRVGGGFLLDYGATAQDENSKEQVVIKPDWKIRDSRFMLNGRLKFKRDVTWTAGLMYDGYKQAWLVRQTGIMIKVPEILGYLFIGRTKEGISLNKVMVGYAGWTMERAPISDALIPILADGIQWIGNAPKQHFIWTAGFYGDSLSEGQSFSSYRNQGAGRFAFVPVESERTVLHLGFSARYGKPKDGMLQARSRPELNTAPYFLDTGKFPCDSTTTWELEAYYRPGPFLLGTEYFVQQTNAPKVGNPVFHGGDAVFTWLATGEIRSYNTRGGYFNQISPLRSVYHGGPGAWELGANFSYADLDSGTLRGGKFWRFTPVVNWYLSDNIRIAMEYGYGSLDRFNLVGKTQFFQTRLQLQF
jgi:phosphate-selective porin OprO/OprP